LLVIGFLHAVTLFDFTIGICGFATVLLIGTLRWSDRTVKWGVIASLAVVTLLGSAFVRAEYDLSPGAETVKPDVRESLFMRVFLWMILTPLMVHHVVPAMIGMWAAQPIPESTAGSSPERRPSAFASTAGAIPLALISSGFWADPPTVAKTLVSSLHTVTGYVGGLGWAALIGWTAALVEGKPHPVTRAIAAVGQRSMSFNILQSVANFIAFTPDIGILGNRAGQFGSDVVAWLTWMAPVPDAEIMRRSKTQGPAEAMLRRWYMEKGQNRRKVGYYEDSKPPWGYRHGIFPGSQNRNVRRLWRRRPCRRLYAAAYSGLGTPAALVSLRGHGSPHPFAGRPVSQVDIGLSRPVGGFRSRVYRRLGEPEGRHLQP